jgi:23S rRNA (cytidine1920-2'-O)/16S rRNA (cytidine1409-2'-O)-methyltransferase
MARTGRKPRPLVRELARRFPDLEDPESAVAAGIVLVDGIPSRNPASLVAPGVSVTVQRPVALRGEAKLRHALGAFAVPVAARTALDVGAAAGGFTRVLLEAGAARVYAVDAGHGQLLGSLRQDPRVVALERTNLGALTPELVPDRVEVVTMDLSYLPIAQAAPQLEAVRLSPSADLVALVKPQHELRLGRPAGNEEVAEAVEHARSGLAATGWSVAGAIASPVLGARGAAEWLLHARRCDARARR